MTKVDEIPARNVIIVSGGRNFSDAKLLRATLDEIHAATPITKIVEGGALGADLMARVWAMRREVPFKTYYADWNVYGDDAGPIRNGEMLTKEKPNRVICFPTGGPGTADMMLKTKARKIPLTIVQPET